MRRWRKANYCEPGIGVAKASNRPRPVFLAMKAAGGRRGGRLSPLNQAWTTTARMYLGCEAIK